MAQNPSGCDDIFCQTIIVEDHMGVYVPNAFSPDGDGHNDSFVPVISSAREINSYKLTIFNRWGEVVFHAQNPNQSWNGKYQGKPVESGVYAWRMKLSFKGDGKVHQHTESISVIR